MNPMRFLNQIVVLTGAASGIGRAAARLFAKEGAIQFLLDIDHSGLEETVQSLEPKENAFPRNTDVRNPGEVKNAVEAVIDAYGQIDVLICNAGVVRIGEIEDFTDEDYDLLINVNLKGTYYCCKYAVPYFKRQKHGVIITVASVAAHVGQVQHANYCSTKAAVLGLTRALALDLAPHGVRVNSISPGATDTPMLLGDVRRLAQDRGIDDSIIKQQFESESVLGRWAKPEEIAAGMLFLASGESSYMTGADLRLDGGWTAK
jgi:NAD(P)-dependent dehydrogenase (short-subunit alcohol dehydrogenase family)